MNAYTEGYRKATRYLMAQGLLPAPCQEELQAMWATSPEDRAIVQHICERWETA